MKEYMQRAGFWSLLALVIGVQLGLGATILPSNLAPYGVWGILSFLITGSGVISLALVFAALSENSRAGGPYVYVQDAFGDRAAFVAAWSYWIISWVGTVPILVFAAGSMEMLFGGWSTSTAIIVEITILTVITLINLTGVGAGEIIFSAARVIPFVVFPFIALKYGSLKNIEIPKDISPMLALNKASLIALWGFLGIEAGTTPADTVENPNKTIPRAIIYGTFIVAALYIVNLVSVMSVVPAGALSNSLSPYATYLEYSMGGDYAKVVSVFIIIVCVGCVKSWILTSGEAAYSAAQEQMFPSSFAKRNKFASPYVGVITTSVLMGICGLMLKNNTIKEQINILIEFCSTAYLILYMICAVILGIMMWRRKIAASVMRWSLVTVGLAFCSWAICMARPRDIIGAAMIPLSGVVLGLFRRK
ncbi:APC family permease [Candidatus Hydrogenosomobacter endosymbioticus]|uniref:Arginine/agmatine antiporter n=1 Tax=Candidatus Hydrogenosomobacter endosymbioticus TaxID=2558174 RepID=A0ABN6L3S7_9PROT|nr:amino acid permease [Candidatus Hydrogenosomobacter endosymbioticus]BDB96536.1 amino acid permease [Candidatus Hydrogenosomobacter endosymbioticus]